MPFQNKKYLPILTVRPAEMVALEELPEKDKDHLLPIILLRGWVGSYKLENTFNRIEKAFGDRKWIVDLDNAYLETRNDREVFEELVRLKDPANGYQNWVTLAGSSDNFIPCVRLEDIGQLSAQLDGLLALNKGIAVRFTQGMLGSIRPILAQIAAKQAPNVYVILDFGQERYGGRNPDPLTRAAQIIGNIRDISNVLPGAIVVPSSTSFPIDFASGIVEQDIFERTVFNEIKRQLPDIGIVYSDRGSARAEKTGGGGLPAPRIDFPLAGKWLFFRKDTAQGENYQHAASDAIANLNWNPNLNIWGTQMIKLTSLGDEYAITSPVRSTAVRINIHLHQQLYYDAPEELTNTDDEWQD